MWWFRLASHLKMTVAEARQKITPIEFMHWVAFSNRWMLDADGWEQSAMVCSVTANVAGNKTTPSDFLPNRKQTKKAQTPEEMAAVMEGLFGGS